MRLGPFEVDHPFVLAPMAGITHSPFRQLMREMGSSVVVSELVSANGLHFASEKTLELMKFTEAERKIGLQIFGEDQTNLAAASKMVEKLGADFVDLNLGCPVPKVVRKGGGSALCRDLPKLAGILNAMVQSVSIPVTIKIRTGWDHTSINALDVVRVAADAGVSWVAIHGRTRAQGYSGQADWDLIGDVKAKSPIPILGNGDLTTPELAVRRLRETGVDGVLIGRAALRNPFIFRQAEALWKGQSIAPPRKEDYRKFFVRQRALLEGGFELRKATLHAKKFLAWYSAGFPNCHEYRKGIFETQDPEQLWNDANTFFFEKSGEREWDFLQQPFLMGGHG